MAVDFSYRDAARRWRKVAIGVVLELRRSFDHDNAGSRTCAGERYLSTRLIDRSLGAGGDTKTACFDHGRRRSHWPVATVQVYMPASHLEQNRCSKMDYEGHDKFMIRVRGKARGIKRKRLKKVHVAFICPVLA